MRKLSLIALVMALALLGIASSAVADDDDDVATAKGAYAFSGTAAGSNFVIDPFEWKVRIRADGSVSGWYDYRQVRDGVELTVSGPLTCGVVIENRVWVGGLIEQSSRASLIGLDMWFQAQDNGKGENGTPDMSSTIGAGGPGTAQAYCDQHPAVLNPFLLSSGDLKVHPAEQEDDD
jgi:opacity protein-like surface antigen